MSDSKNDAKTRFYFDTETLPEHNRFSAWCEEIMRRFAAFDVIKHDDVPFRASSDARRVGAIEIGAVATTPADFLRTPELIRDGNDSFCVGLTRSGAAYQSQHGEGRQLHPGEGVICENNRLSRFVVTAPSRLWILAIPRSQIVSVVPHAARPGGALLDRDPVALRLLFGYLQGTIDVDLPAGRAARLHEDHIVDLVALALGATSDQQAQIEERSLRAVRRGAVLREVGARMGDPNLSAASVGAKLGVTARYVHLLLEETGQSFTQHLINRRLERAAELLRDPRHHHRRIGDIAFEVGFVDLSHFNRTFRRCFGETPSGMREEASRAKWSERARS